MYKCLYFLNNFNANVCGTNHLCTFCSVKCILHSTGRYLYTVFGCASEFVIVEILRQFCLLDLTADFEVKKNAKLTPDCQLRERAKP